MIRLYVATDDTTFFVGHFQDKTRALRWFYKNKYSFQNADGSFGSPLLVFYRKR